uniref:YTH domain-containing protein n=1 Tax=Ganoderma boninense TaxID=34458 RepID=A0A5K1K628_9APHY|nr:YTH domain-containing protein [Ganoderma boninense]
MTICFRSRGHTLGFTGYVFPDAPSISPYLEEPRTGPTSSFCASLAARLHCYVVAGYPERLKPEEVHRVVLPADHEKGTEAREVDKVGANSAALYGPDGQFVGDYRKTNLYETDMTWARAGTGFTTFLLPPPLNTVSLGICMDLNVQPPAVWDLTLGPYEVAEYCAAQRTNLLVLLNAWLDSKEDPEEDIDWDTINYWALRLRPLWAKVVEDAGDARAETKAHDDAADGAGSDSGSGSGSDLEVNQPRDRRKPVEELVVVVRGV